VFSLLLKSEFGMVPMLTTTMHLATPIWQQGCLDSGEKKEFDTLFLKSIDQLIDAHSVLLDGQLSG
jgi:hypothetical protein